MSYNYKKLKLKIKEVFDTQEAFAEAMCMSTTALSQRLNGATEWKAQEMYKACKLLNIPFEEMHSFFYDISLEILN